MRQTETSKERNHRGDIIDDNLVTSFEGFWRGKYSLSTVRCVHVVNHFPVARAPLLLPQTSTNMSVLTVKLESLNQTVGGWTKLLANLTKVRLELFVRMMREANNNFARWVWRASEGDPKTMLAKKDTRRMVRAKMKRGQEARPFLPFFFFSCYVWFVV